jgi:hypothetical protein
MRNIHRPLRTIAVIAAVLLLAGFGCSKASDKPAGVVPTGSVGVGIKGPLSAPPARPVGEPSRDVPVLDASERSSLKDATVIADQGSSVTMAPRVSLDSEDPVEELIATYPLADVSSGYGIGWASVAKAADGKVMVTGAFTLEAPGEGKVYVAKLVKRGAAPQVLPLGTATYDAANKRGIIAYAPGSDISGYDAFILTRESADGSGSVIMLEGIRTTDF